jgi:hypothetical protein
MRRLTHARLPLLLGGMLLALAACGGDSDKIVITPAKYDFGRVQQGDIPTMELTVTNGTDRVVSLMPQPNCSCFAVERGRSLQPLDPGTSMKVRVMFDTTAKPPGPVQGKWITFNTDHPVQRGILVPLEGEIYRSFDLRPALLNFGRIDGQPRNYRTRVVSVQPRAGYKVRIKRIVASPDIFTIEDKPGADGALDVSVTLRQDIRPRPLGVFRADVRLELELEGPKGTRFSQHPVVKITGTWMLKP